MRSAERRIASTLLVLITLACVDTRGAADDSARVAVRPPKATPAAIQHYADTLSIAARADSIDRYVDAHPDRVTMFAKVPKKAGLVPVKDTASWPESTEISYSVVRDSIGRPLIHRQSPTSESGDWFAVESHYFAPDGRTILHQYRISGFSSECTKVLRETKRVFLGPAGAALAETRSFADVDHKPIVADSCYRRSDDAPTAKHSASELPFVSRQ